MAGPVNKPLPLRQEDERVAAEEAFWDDLEARAKAAEFLPIDRPDEERWERERGEWSRNFDFKLYSEWGVVR